ncbi:MAG: phospholipase [Candidatus Latescibacteria bacterium]|nr:phospholipase [Candidatus Latescibacterota bacterium]
MEFHCVTRSAGQGEDGGPLLILLHGYGSNEEDLLGLMSHLDPRLMGVGIRAPFPLDWGGHAWFPIEMTEAGLQLDFSQALEICQLLGDEIDRIRNKQGAERVFILGFSQGASMALGVALGRPLLAAGVVGMSGLCVEEMLPADRTQVQGLPILLTHGRQDPVIPIHQGRSSRDLLAGLPVALSYREYDMGHEVGADCLDTVDQWVRQRLD